MKLDCPKCGNEILAGNMNLDRMVAKCNTCHSVFSFADQFGTMDEQKLDAPKPDKVTVENWGSNLVMRWHWFNWSFIFLTLFALFWNGIMFSIAVPAIFLGAHDGFSPFSFSIFLLPHFWVGIGLAYYVLTGYINRTTVTADHTQLIVRHGPLPWWGNKNIAPSDIVQLYTKQAFSRHRRGSGSTFEVHAILGKGKHNKILSGLDSSEHALFVEQQLEAYYGIKDKRVRGEYGR